LNSEEEKYSFEMINRSEKKY